MKGCINFLDIYIEVEGSEEIVNSITFSKMQCKDNYTDNSEVKKALEQLNEYLNGERCEFDLNLNLSFSSFNSKVYENLMKVSFGSTTTYKELAQKSGSPKAYRAVGNANNKNKFVVVIPCHRVIGTNSKLVGFAPGLKYKEYLLNLESKGE